MKNKVVIVTGGNSGIGKQTALALNDMGCTVYDFSRREIYSENIIHIKVDVTDEESVISAVNYVLEKESRIDIVVNCAGFGISGAVEFTSLEDAKAQFDVNFFGMVNVNKTVIPFMRKTGVAELSASVLLLQLLTFRSRPFIRLQKQRLNPTLVLFLMN